LSSFKQWPSSVFYSIKPVTWHYIWDLKKPTKLVIGDSSANYAIQNYSGSLQTNILAGECPDPVYGKAVLKN